MELKEALSQYKECTIKLIKIAQNEEYDDIEYLFQQRENLISSMKEIEYTKEAFKKIENDLQILDLEKQLKSIIVEKQDEVKGQLNKLIESSNANKIYSKKDSSDSMFFNKKI